MPRKVSWEVKRYVEMENFYSANPDLAANRDRRQARAARLGRKPYSPWGN